jgi:hypothetical protein
LLQGVEMVKESVADKQLQIHDSKLAIPNSLVRKYLPLVLEV